MTHPELRKAASTAIKWGLGIFLFFNAFSWNPGYGGRTDREPGREVERYFGWPSCYYCDLWRSDHPHEINLPAYFPPYPLTGEMYFVYCSYSMIAFLLNLSVACCGVGNILLLLKADSEQSAKGWMFGFGIALAAIGILIVVFGDEMSAYL